MPEISLTTNKPIKSRKLPNAVRELGKLPTALDKIGVSVVRGVRRNCNGRYLQRRTGRLHDSWGHVVEQMSNSGWRLVVQSVDVPYARIHDLGGMTGRGHRSKMRKRSYATKAWIEAKRTAIKRIMRDFNSRIFRG